MRPVGVPANALQRELGVTYEKISVNAALQMIEEAKRVDWPSLGKNCPEDFITALQKLAKDQISIISPMMKMQTYNDAVAYLENPKARALVDSYVDARKAQLMATDQQQQA